ncbi:tetranectin-like [Denticeps clupeoides]|uniref:C-type lectin domain-containing protein n=1 Tax=Denticeps clupeoides TaxID=299321 RepID=A0A8C4AUB3_9TELE|nr:tetranectin-like [Denticeps clupeoides]XP_028822488.1 tetranectin-like [Denticeps clupeoides]
MDFRRTCLLLGVTLLFLGHSTSQQMPAKNMVKNEPQQNALLKDLQLQVLDIVKEVHLLKEQLALQIVCLKGDKLYGKCILAEAAKKRYHAASEDCNAKGGVLATPSSHDENQKLHDYVRRTIGPEEQIWLGINDIQTEGVWTDQTGSSVTYKNWDPSFSSSGDRALNCAVLSAGDGGKWLDENCREERASVCEFNIV